MFTQCKPMQPIRQSRHRLPVAVVVERRFAIPTYVQIFLFFCVFLSTYMRAYVLPPCRYQPWERTTIVHAPLHQLPKVLQLGTALLPNGIIVQF